jgi:translation initiation factor 1
VFGLRDVQSVATMRAMRKSSSAGGLVYSTDSGRTCPACRQAQADCRCKVLAAATALAKVAQGDGIARVTREKQGRGGKTVTVVRGLPLDAEALAALGKRLRNACGAGGTTKDGVLEVQGDHAERVVALLLAEGHKAKRAGG